MAFLLIYLYYMLIPWSRPHNRATSYEITPEVLKLMGMGRIHVGFNPGVRSAPPDIPLKQTRTCICAYPR